MSTHKFVFETSPPEVHITENGRFRVVIRARNMFAPNHPAIAAVYESPVMNGLGFAVERAWTRLGLELQATVKGAF